MKALVLAAGKGSRLGAAAGGLPKPLTDIGGTTPLEHALQWLTSFGVEHIWINVHAHADVVTQRIGRRVAGVPIDYSWEPELLGTAGAWKKLAAEWEGRSLVIYGDNFMRFDLAKLVATHERAGMIATVAVYDPAVHANTGPGGGRVGLDGDRITRFVEGGDEGMINAGAYVLEPSVLETIGAGFSDFGHDVLPRLAERRELAAHVLEDSAFCMGVDTPERLEIARRIVRAAGLAELSA
jgi:mannose-1-phosphate guanylyltransferase